MFEFTQHCKLNECIIPENKRKSCINDICFLESSFVIWSRHGVKWVSKVSDQNTQHWLNKCGPRHLNRILSRLNLVSDTKWFLICWEYYLYFAISFYLFTLVSNFQEHICQNPDLILNLISFFSKRNWSTVIALLSPVVNSGVHILICTLILATANRWGMKLLQCCVFGGSRALSLLLMNALFSSS